jgi:hypothetical protein
LDKKTLDQPQKSISNYYINAGGHQIPIFAGTPAIESPLSMAKFEEMKRVPCSTLLVRIVPVKHAEKGASLSTFPITYVYKCAYQLIVFFSARSGKPPVYGIGEDYDTSMSFPNNNEINLYQLVCAERPTMFIGGKF